MDRTTKLFLLCLLLAGLFVFLFHGTGIGINLLLYELIVLFVLWRLRSGAFDPLARLAFGGMLLTAFLVVLHGSLLTVVVNSISVVLAIGVLLAPGLNALHRSAALALAHIAAVPLEFLRTIPIPKRYAPQAGPTWKGVLSVTLVPVVILIFIALYRSSNPHFDQFMDEVSAWINRIDITIFRTFFIGLLISGFLLLANRNETLLRWASNGNDQLPSPTADPQETKRSGEILTGTVLLASLNLLLLVANVLDLQYVWFGFQFDGQFLKQFVHEGTYMLLLSIFFGAAIVLYFFRGDLNFHSRNRVLKLLSYAWLAQNALLALSVGMRNFWYIQYYALAYRRIGVGFFLIAICIGLILVMVKVYRGRSDHFLLRTNAVAVYCTALIMALFNWDGIIARYNMEHREHAFVHLNFMSTLADKALPDLLLPLDELNKIDAYNKNLIGEKRYYPYLYMTPENYRSLVDRRIEKFLAEYPERSWREWDLADARAYETLKSIP